MAELEVSGQGGSISESTVSVTAFYNNMIFVKLLST